MKKNVVVMFGGVSSEHNVSLWSSRYIIESLNKEPEKYSVFPVGITRNGEWFLYTGSVEHIAADAWLEDKKNVYPALLSPSRCSEPLFVLKNGKYETKRVDVIFPVFHGKNGEDGTIQGLCELANKPYVGCDVYSSSACMDKVFTNILLTEHRINKARYTWFFAYDYIKSPQGAINSVDSWANGKYPVFVKPARSGSSVGISKVLNKEELKPAIEKALESDSKILIEEGIDAREVECAVLGDGDDIFTSVLGEVIPFNNFYDYESKYSKNSKLVEEARLSIDVKSRIEEIAKNAYRILGCSGLSRVDFLLEKDTDKIFLNEINTMPGFTEISMYPKLMLKSGFTMSKILEKLIIFANKKKAVKDATK